MENKIIEAEAATKIINDIARGLCHGCTITEDSPLAAVLSKCYSLEMLYDLQQVQADLYNKDNSMPCGTWEYKTGIIPTLSHKSRGNRLQVEACQYNSGIMAIMWLSTTQGQPIVSVDLGSRTYHVREPEMLKWYRLSILRDIGFEDVFYRIVEEYDIPEES